MDSSNNTIPMEIYTHNMGLMQYSCPWAMDQEMADKIRSLAMTKAASLYSTYHNTPHFILPCHKYLFMNKTLAQRLCLNIDILRCWIRSVEDAIQALTHHDNQQRLYSNHFFASFLAASRNQQDTITDSHGSTFSPPSHPSE